MKPLEYLSAKVSKVVLDSDKVYNEGARLLATFPDWELILERLIQEAWSSLLKYCVRNKAANYSAAVKLTFASDLIGKRIAREIGADETVIKSTLALGDIMLETFLQCGLIEIFREYEGHRAPYMVRIIGDVDSVRPVLIGTVFSSPSPIRGLRSPITKEPFIKGWHDQKLFQNYLDAPFIKTLNQLRSQAWRLNEAVLEVLKENPPSSILQLVDEDGVIHDVDLLVSKPTIKNLRHIDGTEYLGNKDTRMQKMMSKLFEYSQIVAKAEMVKQNGGVFYQEVSCDYRGRVYYAEPFFEFQGSDLARALFLFAEEKPVDARGEYWLNVYAATSYNQSYTIKELKELTWLTTDYVKYLKEEKLDTISVDKMTMQDRHLWMINNMHHFVCPTNSTPVFTQKAEKPYAFYAALLELARLKTISGYKSGLPIPIDGSNNGKP